MLRQFLFPSQRVVAINAAQRLQHIAALLRKIRRYFHELAPSMSHTVSQQDLHAECFGRVSLSPLFSVKSVGASATVIFPYGPLSKKGSEFLFPNDIYHHRTLATLIELPRAR